MWYRWIGGRRLSIDLDDLFKGASAFLLGGGPSLKEQASALREAQIITMAMNNAAVTVRPTMWIGADEAGNYSPSVVADPGPWKFMRINRRNTAILGTKRTAGSVPNMYFLGGYDKINYKTFFKKQRDFVFWKNVFTMALQVLARLGFTRVYAVGCGFKISEDAQYSHESDLNEGEVKYNQATYDSAMRQVKGILPFAKDAGFELISCTADSKLNDHVEYVPLENALAAEAKRIPPVQTTGLGHPIRKREKEAPGAATLTTPRMFPNEDMKPSLGGKYVFALEHRKLVLSALPPKGRMLEYGSGASTIWFRANLSVGQSLFSIEHSEGVAHMTGAIHVPYKPGDRGTPQAEDQRPGWENYVFAPLQKKLGEFDVILVDGVVRDACLLAIASGGLLKPGGVVFLHDSERRWYDKGRALYNVQRVHAAQPDYPKRELWEGRDPKKE